MARPTSTESARRLIALLGRFHPGERISLARLAEEVGVTAAQLADDLGTLSLCGVAPYFPDMLVDVFVEDGMVEVFSPLPAIRGPIRLSSAEAEALCAALSAAGFSADDPLTVRLLDASSAGFDARALAQILHTASAGHDGGVFETLASAIATGRALEIEYHSEGAQAPTQRIIEPQHLFAERGSWYTRAWCRSAGALRTFRVDRIRTATPIGAALTPVAPGGAEAFSSEGLPVARLRFAPREEFIEREWPGGQVVESFPDGSVIAEVPFGGTAWIARRVVARLGAVEALEPVAVRTAVAALAAEELAGLTPPATLAP